MIAFAGAPPLTQTIYGFLLMNFIKSAVDGYEQTQDLHLALNFLRTCDRTFRIIPGQVCSRSS